MSDREIPYDRTGSVCGLCPMCGAEQELPRMRWACVACLGTYASRVYESTPPLAGEYEIRDLFYDLGVRLRSEGQLPPLGKMPLGAREACTGCNAHPCDCWRPIWSWMKLTGGDADKRWEWCTYGVDRAEALRLYALQPKVTTKRGPVIRLPVDGSLPIHRVEITVEGSQDPSMHARKTTG